MAAGWNEVLHFSASFYKLQSLLIGEQIGYLQFYGGAICIVWYSLGYRVVAGNMCDVLNLSK